MIVQLLIVGSLVLALGYLTALCILTVVTAVRAGGRREDAPESAAALAASRLTIPVSIIVPAGSALQIGRAIHDLLDLNYPEFEVIVVVDKPATAVEAIAGEWQLEPVEFFYRRTLGTAPVRRIFRSQRDTRLIVVEKEAAHESDALNAGVNIGRYRFVAVVPLDASFDRNALLRSMAPALDDPRSVVGVFSLLEPCGVSATAVGGDARFLRLRSVRASMVARLFHPGHSRQVDGHGVRLWRRDAVLGAGGFSTRDARPDVAMAFRVSSDADCRVVCAPEPFGRTSVTTPRLAAAGARDRQRAAFEVLRSMGTSSLSITRRHGFGAFLEAELITPLAQFWVIAASIVGVAIGAVSWPAALASVLLLSFGTAIVSAAAVLLAGSQDYAPKGSELKSLLLAAPLEVVLHRPRLAWSRATAFAGSSVKA